MQYYPPMKNDYRCELDISFFAWGSLEITIKVRLNCCPSNCNEILSNIH